MEIKESNIYVVDDYFEGIKVCDVIVGYKPHENQDWISILPHLPRRQELLLDQAEDKKKYVKEHLWKFIIRSPSASIFFHLDYYNKVFQYFNMDKRMFGLSVQDAMLYSKQPPDIMELITDSNVFPNVYAIKQTFPDYDFPFDIDELFVVRKYFETKDPFELKLGFNEAEQKKIFDKLVSMKKVRKTGGMFYVPAKESMKRKRNDGTRLTWEYATSVIQPTWNLLIDISRGEMYSKFKVWPHARFEAQEVSREFKWREDVLIISTKNLRKSNIFYFDSNLIKSHLMRYKKIRRIILVFSTKQEQNRYIKIPHLVVQNVTRAEGIYINVLDKMAKLFRRDIKDLFNELRYFYTFA